MTDQNHPNGRDTEIGQEALEQLRKLGTIQRDIPANPPPPVISESLVERAPAEMPAIVRSMHHTAAQALDDAADHLEREMQSHLVLMRDAANELRIQGDSQANTIEALSMLIRDTHAGFKLQADKLARFRAGETE